MHVLVWYLRNSNYLIKGEKIYIIYYYYHLSKQKECIGQGNDLVTSGLWKAVMEYVLMAWSYVDDLPTWDSPAHNTSKSSCFKTLAVHFQQALSNGTFSRQEYKIYQAR